MVYLSIQRNACQASDRNSGMLASRGDATDRRFSSRKIITMAMLLAYSRAHEKLARQHWRWRITCVVYITIGYFDLDPRIQLAKKRRIINLFGVEWSEVERRSRNRTGTKKFRS